MNKNKITFLLFIFAILNTFKNVELNSRLQERRKFKNEDFKFDLAGAVPGVIGKAGTGTLLSVEELPALKGY